MSLLEVTETSLLGFEKLVIVLDRSALWSLLFIRYNK